ncbi:PPC domain-containing protein [Capilliphycus salinus ALCB114379]|uniref:PPC domain-containing protein n=1 Tax=Capilliphycus salinus TaxID=2768948 RepID=UPI0039A421A5
MTTLSLTASPTTLIEAESTVLTLNFNLDEAPPPDGLLVTLSSDMINSLGEFDVFATQFSGAQLVSVSDDTDGFTLRLTEQNASISLPVFTDNEEEGSETITFTVEPSEEFTLDSDASSVEITLEDTADSTPTPPPVTSFYDEAVDGDISGDRNAPTMLELEQGVNSLTATSVAGDIEYVTLTVPEGLQLDSVDVASYASDTDDIAFAAVQTGSIFTEPPTQTDVENLLGYSHFGAIDVGTDILEDLANGQGAIGFDSPLPSGDYTFWLQQTGDASTYSLDFNVSQAEDPVTPGENPMVSVSALGGTFNDSELISPNIVESAGEAVPILSLAVSVDGEIPEDGLIVNINSNLDDITEFIQGANFIPPVFGPGEVLGAIYNSDGTATGLQLRLDGPNAVMNFVGVGFEAEGSQSVSFFVEDGVGYEAASGESIVKVYDSLDEVPQLTNPPLLAMEFVSSSDTLIEGGSPGTLNFTVDGEIPPEGLVVYVTSGILAKLGEFNLFDAVVTGGGFPSPDENAGGFYFKITEPTASIELQAFADDIVEGLESVTFSLQEVPGYAIADNASIVNFAIADDANSLTQVSLEASPEVLIESENTVSVHTFSLSSPPPAEGLTVSVDTPNLNEFDLDSIEVEGATIAEVRDDGFDLTITEQAATVNLAVAEDNESEGLETAVFTVAEGEGYQVSPEVAEANFTIVDTTDQAPPAPLEISEPNDTIAEAIATNLSADNNTVSLDSAISFTFGNRLVDQTEDVDMYSFELEAGDTVVLDIDAELLGSSLDSVLRLFDAEGNQLAQSNDDFAPNELVGESQSDSYLEFTAETEGTYYVGVSSSPNGEFDFENNPYEPFEGGSGSGSSSGEYTLNLLLNQEIPSEPTQDGIENPGSVPVTDDGEIYDDDTEFNDTIANANLIEVGVNSTVTLAGEIGTTPETRNLIDRSEDVDMYGFELEAGQTLVLDVDAGGSGDAGVEGSLMDSVLRIFDSQGNEVAVVENAAAPDEIFQANGDTYLK